MNRPCVMSKPAQALQNFYWHFLVLLSLGFKGVTFTLGFPFDKEMDAPMIAGNTWTVVQFESDNTVEAVPTSWINENNQCIWPPLTQDRRKAAIRNCEINTHWPSHKIRVFKDATYDDYITARAKSKKAENTSDLNSDVDSKRRKIRTRQLSSSGSESSSPGPISRKKLPTPPRKISTNRKQTQDDDTLGQNFSVVNRKSTPIVEDSVLQSTPTRSSTVKDSRSCSCKADIKTLFMIKHICCDILEKVNNLEQIRGADPVRDEVVPILNQVEVDYPIVGSEDLNTFETFFTNQDKYNLLVRMFSKIGGTTTSEFVKRCLEPVLSDELAENFSYLGRKQKRKFYVLKLSKAVVDAADKVPAIQSNKECENAIALWLKRAKARLDRQRK